MLHVLRRTATIVGLSMLVLLAVALQAPAQTNRRPVVLGFFSEPDVLNPLATNTIAAVLANRTFLDPLVEYDLSLQLRPVMVETIPSLENGFWKLLPGGRRLHPRGGDESEGAGRAIPVRGQGLHRKGHDARSADVCRDVEEPVCLCH